MQRTFAEQTILNFMPVIGYWFLGWSMFAIVYLFWVEAVIWSLFYVLEKFFARGEEVTGERPTWFKRLKSSFKILLFRWGILLFYWLFILVFVALGQGKLQGGSDESLANLRILAFIDHGFNTAVLAILFSGIAHFFQEYIVSGKYRTSLLSDYHSVFDAKTISIHLLIILGTFSYQFLAKYASLDHRLPGLGFVLVLSVIKTLVDAFLRFGKGFSERKV